MVSVPLALPTTLIATRSKLFSCTRTKGTRKASEGFGHRRGTARAPAVLGCRQRIQDRLP